MNIAVFQSIGPTELIIVLVIVLVIFGPKRLPALGKQLGSGMREFRNSVTGRHGDDDDDDDTRAQANAALGRPDSEPAGTAEGDVVSERERTPR